LQIRFDNKELISELLYFYVAWDYSAAGLKAKFFKEIILGNQVTNYSSFAFELLSHMMV
jgi:hypothetical protein